MVKSKVFLDTSVIITAILSSNGGSFHILTSLKNNFIFQINDYVLGEAKTVLQNKLLPKQPPPETALFLLLGLAGILTLPNPSKSQVLRLATIINLKDAPILASALDNSDFLVTLDNDFLKPKVIGFAKSKSLAILKPKEFIEQAKNSV